MRAYLHRFQAPAPKSRILAAGCGGAAAIAILGALSVSTGTALLMGPFGASCVLLFSVPQSPLSQPANVVGGHVLATAIGLALHAFFPNHWWAAGVAVGIAISLMAALRITHPPAGADPLVVFATDPSLGYLVAPVALGALTLVGIAALFHRMTGTVYPLPRT